LRLCSTKLVKIFSISGLRGFSEGKIRSNERYAACKNNKTCKTLYDRIVAKGKSKKLALIAVCNKLLKQAFAIAIPITIGAELIYNETYRSTLVRN